MPHRSALLAVGATTAALGVVAYTLVPKPPTASEKPRRQKLSSETGVAYACKVSPEYADEHGRVYGGELLKMIDVAAGIVAAKHAGGPCLTVSLDRVIFLEEIKVGDVVHFSSAVNRSWGTSMEIGVRVMRESASNGTMSYCSHAYLTFVAKPHPAPIPTFPLSLAISLNLASAPKPTKFIVPEIKPVTTLESKRYLLAGRRRAHRMQGRDANEALLKAFRLQVVDIEKEQKKRLEQAESEIGKDELIQSLQLEMIVEGFIRQDPDVKVEGSWVIFSIEGFTEPVRVPLAEVEKAVSQRGRGGYRRLTIPSQEVVDQLATKINRGNSSIPDPRSIDIRSPIDLADTMVMGLWIVRPQHCNSKQILFGGTLMRWIEEISSVAARRVSYCPWSSAAIDSLTFKSSVLPGEIVIIRAVVVKAWESSVECYAVAMAEDRNSPNPTTRFVSDSFFTLVAIDSESGRPLKGHLRHVNVPEGPARQVANGADARRDARLQDKRVLQRVYASTGSS